MRDLVEIVFECYGFLSEILENYRPSGEDSEDAIIVALSSLFAHWPPEKLKEIRNIMKQSTTANETSHSSQNRKRRDSESRKSMTSSFMSASSKMLSGMKLGFRNRTVSRGGNDTSPENTPCSSPSVARPTEKKKPETNKSLIATESTPTSTSTTQPDSSSNESQQAPPALVPQSSTTSSISSPSSPKDSSIHEGVDAIVPEENPEENMPTPTYKEKIASSPINGGFVPSSNGGITTKNQEYFKKMREVKSTICLVETL